MSKSKVVSFQFDNYYLDKNHGFELVLSFVWMPPIHQVHCLNGPSWGLGFSISMKKFEKNKTIEKYILIYKTKVEELIYNKQGYIKQQYKCNLWKSLGSQM